MRPAPSLLLGITAAALALLWPLCARAQEDAHVRQGMSSPPEIARTSVRVLPRSKAGAPSPSQPVPRLQTGRSGAVIWVQDGPRPGREGPEDRDPAPTGPPGSAQPPAATPGKTLLELLGHVDLWTRPQDKAGPLSLGGRVRLSRFLGPVFYGFLGADLLTLSRQETFSVVSDRVVGMGGETFFLQDTTWGVRETWEPAVAGVLGAGARIPLGAGVSMALALEAGALSLPDGPSATVGGAAGLGWHRGGLHLLLELGYRAAVDEPDFDRVSLGLACGGSF